MSMEQTKGWCARAVRAALLVLACTAIAAAAQSKSPPSWGTVQSPQPSSLGQSAPGSSISAQGQQSSGAQARQTQAPGNTRQLPGARNPTPPQPRDCRKAVTQPDPSYVVHFNRSETNGYTSPPNVDLGFVINTSHAVGNAVQFNLNDLQVRIEQLRCENENLAAKLDYLGAKLDYMLWKLPQ